MCTVLQQHLARQQNISNGYDTDGADTIPGHHRALSPIRLPPEPTYSYLGAAQDAGLLPMKRPVDPADNHERKTSAPARMHFHVPPPDSEGKRPSSRSRSSYSQQLWGRSRSHSRTGMRILADEMGKSTPQRCKSPHMNNEEPIRNSHFPDGHPPNGNGEDTPDQKPKDEMNGDTSGRESKQKKKRKKKLKPIERDDFPAPPFPYARRRHWSEPLRSSDSSDMDDDEPIEVVESSESEHEYVDPKLDKTEAELKKISNGMASVFIADLAVERQKRKTAMSTKHIDPRSAARTPAANKEPHFRLRYDSPVNASPSRIADHLRPWDDEYDGGYISRRSFFSVTPFLPSTPGLVGATTSPKPGSSAGGGRKSSTLPSRLSPGHPGGGSSGLNYSTDFSTDMSDGEGVKDAPVKPVRVSSAYAPGTPSSMMGGGTNGHHAHGHQGGAINGGGSLPNMGGGSSGPHGSSLAATDDEDDDIEFLVLPQAPNVYPLHLLLTSNYRLPGDVDRCNLERHLTDTEFEAIFKCLRDEFYRLPYWKRCELKRKNFLF